MRTVDPGDARELQLASPEGVRHARLMRQARAGTGEQDESLLLLAAR